MLAADQVMSGRTDPLQFKAVETGAFAIANIGALRSWETFLRDFLGSEMLLLFLWEQLERGDSCGVHAEGRALQKARKHPNDPAMLKYYHPGQK